MIHKIIKGGYFKGALLYVLDPAKGFLIGGTFGSRQSPEEIAREMREVAGDRLRKPVFHAVLSLRPGEALSNDQWNDAARRYLTALGYDDTPYVLVRHTNREHDHVHIVASRVRYDGTVVSDRQDRFKGLAAVRELSREHGLSMGASSGRSVLAGELRTLIRRSAEGKPSVTTFLSRLEASGVRVTAHLSPGARKKVQGLSFHLDGTTFKASQLGRELTWSGLQKNLGVRYDPATDLPALLERSSRHQGAHADRSAWSPETIRDLSTRLRTLRMRSGAGGTAARDLVRQGAEAFRLSAHVARFLGGSLRPADASRRMARSLAPGEHLSLALSFLGAVRSPGTAALFLLRFATRPARNGGAGPPADPAVLFLRQAVHAAAGDRPAFEVFRDRLAEAGVHLGGGTYVLPDRVIPGRQVGLGAPQLERLGVQNAAERFGGPDRPVRLGDRDRRDGGRDASSGGSPVEPGLRPDRGAHTAARPAPGADRGAGEAPARPDRGAHLGRGTSAQQPQTAGRPDLGHSVGARSRDEPPAPGHPDGSAARVVPDRAAPGPAPDRTAPLRAHPPAPGGPATSPLVPSPGALIPRELTLQLQAFGGGGVEIRLRTAERTVTHRVLTPDVLDRLMPALVDVARRGGTLEIRALDPGVQHLAGVTAETLARARRAGAEPALVLKRGDGTLDVWLRHSPSASPKELPYLSRTLRAEYGQPPLGAARPFGPVAGLDPAVRLIEAPGAPYTRAQALADFFAVSRRALDEQLAARLRAVGVSPLAQYRTANPGPAADREWSRFALRQGLAPRDVAQELLRSGARAQAGPRAQALYTSRVLAATFPGISARDLPKQLLSTASQVLGVSVNALSIARSLLSQAVRLTLGRD